METLKKMREVMMIVIDVTTEYTSRNHVTYIYKNCNAKINSKIYEALNIFPDYFVLDLNLYQLQYLLFVRYI